MRDTGINAAEVKLKNRLLTLRLICANKDLSRTDLTGLTGLTKMTLSNIINDLTQSGLVTQLNPSKRAAAGVGRRPMALGVAPAAPKIIGLSIERDGIYGVLADMQFSVIRRSGIRFCERETAKTITNKLKTLAAGLIVACDSQIAGIGVSCVGVVDSRNGVMTAPLNFFGITNYSVKAALLNFGLPVFVQNDANAAALAEKHFGHGRDMRDFVYVSLSRGMGAGIIIDDRLFAGSCGCAGEIGHVPLDGGDELCRCGRRGCLELYLSAPRLLDDIEHKTGRRFGHISEVMPFYGRDAKIRRVMDAFLQALACGLLNICNLFDPPLIIIGHDGACLTDDMLLMVKRLVNEKALSAHQRPIDVERAHFGGESALMGAATLVLDGIFSGELGVLS